MLTRDLVLPSGEVALIDDADFDLVRPYRWFRKPGRNTVYVVRCITVGRKNKRFQYLHSFLTDWDRVDHINGMGLDNRRLNLRPATHAQNLQNRPGMPNTLSQYKGVSRRREKWRAVIKGRELGLFEREEDAARCYDQAAHEMYGDFAWLNFPRDVVLLATRTNPTD